VTISEPDAEGGQPSVLVIVPDSQLSLAIGKRGQNARLAAKLTGLRVDIKSESEVEDERRREEEELAQGRQFLSAFPDVTPPIQDALIAAGLCSPARIARADLAALADVAGLGERKAKSLLEAAQAWVAEHAAVAAAEEAIAGEDELSASENRPGDGEVVGDSQEPKAPSTAGE
jgi:N utilization substance protein A